MTKIFVVITYDPNTNHFVIEQTEAENYKEAAKLINKDAFDKNVFVLTQEKIEEFVNNRDNVSMEVFNDHTN